MIWKDRVTATPHDYDIGGTTYTLTAVPGAVTESGTPLNAANMSRLEAIWDETETMLLIYASPTFSLRLYGGSVIEHTYPTTAYPQHHYYIIHIDGGVVYWGDGTYTALPDYEFTGFYYNGTSAAICEAYLGNNCPYNENSFRGCSSLEKVVFAEYTRTTIGENMFSGCTKLKSIKLPESITAINDYAFYGCDELSDIFMGESVTTWGYAVFGNCNSLTQFKIPDSLTDLGTHTFAGCYNLMHVSITNSTGLTNIGTYCFAQTGLREIILPSAIVSIGAYAFENCKFLQSVIVKGAATLSNAAFSTCESLRRIEIENVTDIGTYSFYNCTDPITIKFGSSAPAFDTNSFLNCRVTDIIAGSSTVADSVATSIAAPTKGGTLLTNYRKLY